MGYRVSGDTLEFSLANDLRELSDAAVSIDRFCRENSLAPEVSFDVCLAIDELVANTIEYGYDDEGEHRIDLALCLDKATLTVRIVDDGKAFDPLQAPEPDMSAPAKERARGGLGIYLVHKLMDGIDYRRHDGRNHVTLTIDAARRQAE